MEQLKRGQSETSTTNHGRLRSEAPPARQQQRVSETPWRSRRREESVSVTSDSSSSSSPYSSSVERRRRRKKRRYCRTRTTRSRSRSGTPPSRHHSIPKHWADRMTGQEGLDFSRTIRFESSDPEDQPSGLVEVSDQTKSFLEQVCTRRMPNKERLTRRSRYLLPKVPATRTPQLDSFMKPEVSSATKNVDRELVKVQTLILDALAPLTSILEGDNRGERLDQGEVINATKVAVELLGNASAHVTHARRTTVTSDLNN